MTIAIAPTPTPTSVTPPPRAIPVVAAPPTSYRFSVKQYQQMIEVGVLTDDDKIELLEGYLVTKMPRNPPHENAIQRFNRTLSRLTPDEWRLRCQSSIVCTDSQPEPDFAIVKGDDQTFALRHPAPVEVGLAIEVSDSSLTRDRIDKTRIYARAGIVEYWIVNLVDRQIEVHTLPVGDSYTNVQNYTAWQSLPLTLDGVAVAMLPIESLLP